MAMEQRQYGAQPEVWEPLAPEEAWGLKRKFGETAIYVSGGTLLRTQWENETRPLPDHMISLADIAEMKGIVVTDGFASIGAVETLNDCRGSDVLRSRCPLLAKAIGYIAAPAVRHLATLGGNIGSLIGDAVPALLALDAQLLLYQDHARRRMSLRQWLEGAGGARQPDDLLLRVLIPIHEQDGGDVADGGFAFYEKVGRRESFTPSLATVAGTGHVDDSGLLFDVRLTAGGGTAIPHRLTEAEAALNGTALSEGTLSIVHEIIKRQYAAAGGLFAGSDYRKEASANLITAQFWKLLKK
ncbi:FAD binding domain-containing protein [Paenibacillus sp. LHD-117]|uniref:FAD binding domain-containing protein n=1 Tax=Paenibacillus sp. LHD-117 TaxID=3071412 RepID=UPI0027DFA5E8|nr:FAD binding domain-containing protein [Paenibacillus sp. LHD-117]MDQ6419134.1 FAD binding domain-containing protein [Paenibacillus sp. LHD-117]